MRISTSPFWRLFLRLLPLETIRSPEGDPYLLRYTLLWTPWLRVYIHNILRSDDDRELHDHPWDFTVRILEGGYIEHVLGGSKVRVPGDVIRHAAEDMHRVELIDGRPAWTFVICGPKRRQWGFQAEDGWVDADTFLTCKESERNATIPWGDEKEQWKMVSDLINRLPARDARIVAALGGKLMHAETDSAYWEAKYKGYWPGDDEGAQDGSQAPAGGEE